MHARREGADAHRRKLERPETRIGGRGGAGDLVLHRQPLWAEVPGIRRGGSRNSSKVQCATSAGVTSSRPTYAGLPSVTSVTMALSSVTAAEHRPSMASRAAMSIGLPSTNVPTVVADH